MITPDGVHRARADRAAAPSPSWRPERPGDRRRRLRIFLGAFGEPGHAFPMLALGAELAARGHEVTYETWERWREHVEAAGMGFVPAPEYELSHARRAIRAVRGRGQGHRADAAAVASETPDVVVHDILTLAPAMAGELEGVPVATLIPHLYPVSAPGFPPYALGARLPRTAVGRMLWDALVAPSKPGYAGGATSSTRRGGGLACLRWSASTAD